MRITLILAAILIITYIVSISCLTCSEKDFSQFKQQFKREYASLEENQNRFQIFCKNLQNAEKLNKLNPKAKFGVTKFSDLTTEEFRSKFLGTKLPKEVPQPTRKTSIKVDLDTLPKVFDWRNNSKTILTPIYDQQQCGSCWSFSATESIESVWALAGHDLVQLSMQQMVDCDDVDYGCRGGFPTDAIEYIVKAGGQELLSDYPYTAVDGTCEFDSSKVVAQVSGWEDAGKNNESAMASYLSSTAPISVGVDATTWSSYQSGIITSASCGKYVNHAVLIVAYNLDENYWTIRNSWGDNWGEQGYVRLEYGADTCDVASYPISAYINSTEFVFLS